MSQFAQGRRDVGAAGLEAVWAGGHGALVPTDEGLEKGSERRHADPAGDEQGMAAAPGAGRRAAVRAVQHDGHLREKKREN